ncbi:hypothetical protein [Vulgatibacter incomptus]|uniref:Uncharacterized protein n=1 Tax=Vulgatibacter incomptus TaxID=1391653 RepID=A0A0K1P8G5_9BACT|nr:hypothetical protein [Vulgatibacter incomptus]AKU89792.1 hypothetical protein AKJ08_0179 [Vulgatibacter incomptus]
MGRDNQDYFKRAGSTGGPPGPLYLFKSKLSQEKAVLHRDQEHVLPSEHRLTGARPRAGSQETPQEEPAAGDPDPAPGGGAADPPHAPRIEHGLIEIEPREEEAPYGFGIPASEEAALGRQAPPVRREMEHRRIGERMARSFPKPFRLLGSAAQAAEGPVLRALIRLQHLGDLARRP